MQHLDDGSLQAWLDRKRSGLEAAEIEKIQAHLDRCAACAARAEELGGLSTQASALLASRDAGPDAIPPYDDVSRRAQALGRAVRSRRWGPTAWAASIAVALGAGWLGNEVYRSGGGPLAPLPVELDVAPPPTETGGATVPGAEAEEASQPAPGIATRRVRSAPGTPVDAPANAASAPPEAVVDAPASRASSPPEPASAPPSAPALRDPVVRGRVVDARSEEPIAAAQVYIAELDVGVLTLQDGSFHLPLLEEDVDEGPLTLTVERIGYRSENRAFTADPGDTVVMDFRVEEEALSLDEIVVTGTAGSAQRRAAGNTMESMSSEIRISAADPALGSGGGWAPRGPAEAEAALGFPIASVPGLTVTSVEVGQVAGVDALRIRQSLAPEATLTLIQARAPLALDATATPDGRAASTTRRSELSIIGAAAVPFDSLNALLARVR